MPSMHHVCRLCMGSLPSAKPLYQSALRHGSTDCKAWTARCIGQHRCPHAHLHAPTSTCTAASCTRTGEGWHGLHRDAHRWCIPTQPVCVSRACVHACVRACKHARVLTVGLPKCGRVSITKSVAGRKFAQAALLHSHPQGWDSWAYRVKLHGRKNARSCSRGWA